MPRRKQIHPLVVRIGQRFHELRKEKGYTLDQVTHGAELRGKGYLSQVERGQALPQAVTMARLAEALGVDLIDLVNFPERGLRNQLTEATRDLSERELDALILMATRLRDEQQAQAARSARANM